MLMGAKTKDKVWRNNLNRGFDKTPVVDGGREWIGKTVDSRSG